MTGVMKSEKMWWPLSPPGGGGVAPTSPVPTPSPSPMPLVTEETKAAKGKVGQRRRGRASTILAGRLMSDYGKKLLGE